MGLGLSIVRRACNKLGHRISLSSEAMRGTLFRIGLPLVHGDVERDIPASTATNQSLRGRVALVVENDPGMRRGYEIILAERLGMVARVTGGTAEALATMGEEPPDIIIADYNLEGDDTGLAAIMALRHESGRHVPAMVVTAHRDPEITRRCNELRVPLIEKPVRPAELSEILIRLLS